MSDATVAVNQVSGDPRDEYITERSTMGGLNEVLTLYRWEFYVIGQADARRTQDPGPSDYICFHEVDGILFLEAKRPRRRKDKKDRQSAAQKRFQQHVERAGGGTCARYLLTQDPVALHHELARIRSLRAGVIAPQA
jgi:hypothetical protein